MWDVNVKSSFFLIKECRESLLVSQQASGLGQVIILSQNETTNTFGLSSMTKAALDNMVKSLSLELKDDLIKVIGLTIEAGIFSYQASKINQDIIMSSNNICRYTAECYINGEIYEMKEE